jgi:hypothetical protein
MHLKLEEKGALEIILKEVKSIVADLNHLNGTPQTTNTHSSSLLFLALTQEMNSECFNVRFSIFFSRNYCLQCAAKKTRGNFLSILTTTNKTSM